MTNETKQKLKELGFEGELSVDRLIDRLPKCIKESCGCKYYLNIYFFEDVSCVDYQSGGGYNSLHFIEKEITIDLTQALAEMWIYLKENNYLKEM